MQLDFNSIIDTLQQRLSLQSLWSRTIFYSAYSYIIRAVAYALEKLSYNAAVYTSESNWFSATIREFLVRQGFTISYVPDRNIAPKGIVWTSFDEDEMTSAKIDDIQLPVPILPHSTYTGNNIIFSKWTEITGQDGVSAFVYEDTTYFTGTVGPISLPVKIGTINTFTYIAEGTPNELIILASNTIDNNEVFVDIVDSLDNVLFSVNLVGKGELFFVQDDVDAYYAELYNSDNFQSVIIKSGDGVKNKKFSPTDIIRIKYAETNGEADDITNTGVITGFSNPITDVTGVAVEMFVTNNDEISDGTNIETIEEIRNIAPKLFNTGYRLGSDSDWETLLTNQSIIKKAIVWSLSDLGESSVSSLEKDTVFGTAISIDGSPLTSTQEDQLLQDVIKDNKAVSERFQWESFGEIFAVFKINAYVTNQSETTIKGLINDALIAEYGILNTDFAINIYDSNFTKIIDNIDPVRYHNTELYYMEKGLSENVLAYQLKPINPLGTAEQQIILLENESLIILRRKIADVWQDPIIVGIDSSSVFIGQNGYTISGSSINYTSGVISFIINDIVSDPPTYGVLDPTDTDPLGYVVSVQYKTRDGNSNFTNDIRLSKIYQITNVDREFNEFTLNYT